MKKIIVLLTMLLFAAIQGAFAQRTINGKVINAADGLPMPGVSVLVKGITTGMATDKDGIFTLNNVPNNAIIQVSFIGFKTVEIPVENETQFNIMLQIDANVLGDVVVSAARVIPPERAVISAIGIVRDKKTLTTSSYTVSKNELVSSGHANFMAIVSSRVPGVNVSTVNNSTIIEEFRGIKSLTRGPQPPLFIIDGFIVFSERKGVNLGYGIPMPPTNDISDIIAQIIVEDIESITIIRGPEAVIRYGTDAASGVVIIEMKK